MMNITQLLIHKLKNQIAYYFYRCMCLFKIDNRKIVITNLFGTEGFSCNLKYIITELIRRNKSYNIIWLVKDMSFTFPDHIKKLRINRFRSLYHLATAKIWIDNQRKDIFVSKRKKQFYIQTWHGCLGLKKIEMHAIDSYKYPKDYYLARLHDTAMIDLFLSGANWFSDIIKSAFLYTGPILCYGLPRNDIFFPSNNTLSKKNFIRSKLNLSPQTCLLMYAPTFRSDETRIDMLDLDLNKIQSFLTSYTNKEWKILLRLHPRLKKLAKNFAYSNSILNVSYYDDIQELLLISDILITDYSSIIFDFSLQYKPGFIYAPDINEYKKKDRNFYFEISSTPFPVAEDEDTLIMNILHFDDNKYQNDLKTFFKTFGLCETGEASKKVADIIEAVIDGKTKTEIQEMIK